MQNFLLLLPFLAPAVSTAAMIVMFFCVAEFHDLFDSVYVTRTTLKHFISAGLLLGFVGGTTSALLTWISREKTYSNFGRIGFVTLGAIVMNCVIGSAILYIFFPCAIPCHMDQILGLIQFDLEIFFVYYFPTGVVSSLCVGIGLSRICPGSDSFKIG